MVNLPKGARIARKTTYYIRDLKYEIKDKNDWECLHAFVQQNSCQQLEKDLVEISIIPQLTNKNPWPAEQFFVIPKQPEINRNYINSTKSQFGSVQPDIYLFFGGQHLPLTSSRRLHVAVFSGVCLYLFHLSRCVWSDLRGFSRPFVWGGGFSLNHQHGYQWIHQAFWTIIDSMGKMV